jgi:hypothetical protein
LHLGRAVERLHLAQPAVTAPLFTAHSAGPRPRLAAVA